MRKLSLAKIGLISAPCLAIGSSTISLSGCSHSDNSISFYKKELYLTSRNITLPFTTSIEVGKTIHIDLINEEQETVFLLDTDIKIQSNANSVNLIVSEKIKSKRTMRFGLEISFPDEPATEKIIVNSFVVHFSYHPEDDDGIRAQKNKIINHNDYVFDFSFQFQYRPQSKVKIELKKDVSHLLSLESWGNDQQTPVYSIECSPIARDYSYYADIQIFLRVSVFSQLSAPFSLQFTFTNSKGRQQITTLDALSISLLYKPNSQVPKDFFCVEEKEDGKNHLTGFKTYVQAENVKHFPILEIPDTVEVVDSLGFKDDFFFDRIVLGQKVEKFMPNSLHNCYGISMIDASKAENVTIFDEEGGPVFEPKTFTHGGVVIVPNCDATKMNEWKTAYQTIGFSTDNDWEILQEKLVLPDDRYEVEHDDENDIHRLVGIRGSDLSNYAVIRMPLNITNIDIDAMVNLINSPYGGINVDGCRFLSISPMVDVFGGWKMQQTHNFFQGLNLRGLVNIPREVKKLPEYCFDSVSRFPELDTAHKLDIVFNTNSAITDLGAFCLSHNSITNIVFPNTVKIANADFIASCKLMETLDFRNYTSGLPEWVTSEGVLGSYFSNVGIETQTQRKIYVSSWGPKQNDWEKWLNDCGLTGINNWQFEFV